MDSPFGMLELHALVIQLSTQKPGLISKEDIKNGIQPKESVACDICGFGKPTPKTFDLPLKQMLTESERKASILIINEAKGNQLAQLLSQSHKNDTQEEDDISRKTHVKNTFANMSKNLQQNINPTTATFWENQTKKVLHSKNPSSHTNEKAASLPPRSIHAFKSMTNLIAAQTEILASAGLKLKKLRSENEETPQLQTSNSHIKKKISESGGHTKENLPIKPWLMKAKFNEEKPKSVRLYKKTTSGSQIKRSTDASMHLKSQKSGLNKILGEKVKTDKSKHVKNIFSRAAGVTKVNKPPRLANIFNTLTHSAKKEEEKVLSKTNFDFLKIQPYETGDKTTQPYIREMFVLVQLRAVIYDEIPSCPLHFLILLSNNTPVSFLAHQIRQFCDNNCEEVYISPNRLHFCQSLLQNDFTLKQCGYRGYCKSHPQKITLYYDFNIPYKPEFLASLNQ